MNLGLMAGMHSWKITFKTFIWKHFSFSYNRKEDVSRGKRWNTKISFTSI